MRLKLAEVASAAAHDPRQAVLDALAGRHEGIEVFHNNILVGTYIAPNLMMKGPKGEPIEFHRTDRQHAEDRYQGKAFLVLKVGPLAFIDDARNGVLFGGKTVAPGDWIMARPSDGPEVAIADEGGKAGTACRVFRDVNIIAKISDPDLIY